MYVPSGFLLLAFVATTSCGPVSKFDFQPALTPGSLHLNPVPAPWNEARLRCHAEDATLMSPTSVEMSRAMLSAMQRAGDVAVVHTGFQASADKANYQAEDGSLLSEVSAGWSWDTSTEDVGPPDVLTLTANGSLKYASRYEFLPYICYKNNNDVQNGENTMNVEHTTNVGSTMNVKQTQNVNDISLHLNQSSTVRPYIRIAPLVGDAICRRVDTDYTCMKDDNVDNGFTCYKAHVEPKTWPQAIATCAQEDASLVIINSETEAEVMRTLFSQHFPGRSDMFVGILYYDRNTWMTIEGQTLDQAGYVKWHSGEPNNSNNNEYCGTADPSALLYDIPCMYERVFICEKPMEKCCQPVYELPPNDYSDEITEETDIIQ